MIIWSPGFTTCEGWSSNLNGNSAQLVVQPGISMMQQKKEIISLWFPVQYCKCEVYSQVMNHSLINSFPDDMVIWLGVIPPVTAIFRYPQQNKGQVCDKSLGLMQNSMTHMTTYHFPHVSTLAIPRTVQSFRPSQKHKVVPPNHVCWFQTHWIWLHVWNPPTPMVYEEMPHTKVRIRTGANDFFASYNSYKFKPPVLFLISLTLQ